MEGGRVNLRELEVEIVKVWELMEIIPLRHLSVRCLQCLKVGLSLPPNSIISRIFSRIQAAIVSHVLSYISSYIPERLAPNKTLDLQHQKARYIVLEHHVTASRRLAVSLTTSCGYTILKLAELYYFTIMLQYLSPAS